MEDFNSKYSGEQVEALLDRVASGNTGGGSGGGITVELDPVFSASPAAAITDEKITEWNNKYTKPSGGITQSDLSEEVNGALRDAIAYKGTVTQIRMNGSSFSPNGGEIDLGNLGTYSKPSTGIPKSDLNTSVQTSLGKADTAVQPGDLKDEVYIADFTMESLRVGAYNGTNVDCNVQGLVTAMNANKVILVREDEDSAYKGVYVLNGFAEDLLYFSIVGTDGDIYWCEGTDYWDLQHIDGSTLRIRSWDNKQDAISDLATIRSGAAKGATAVQPKDVLDIVNEEGFVTAEDLAGVATSGSYNDLVDKPTFKTINGESIAGSGDITVGGVSEDYVDNAIANAVTNVINASY